MKVPARTAALGLIATVLCVEVSTAHDRMPDASLGNECSARLHAFIKDLDEILDSDPNSVDPLNALLKKALPVSNCKIDQAIGIVRQSRYFSGVGEQPEMHVVTFGIPKTFRRSGIVVIFGLKKESGDSRLPFAMIQK
jgi:hypothetical protein